MTINRTLKKLLVGLTLILFLVIIGGLPCIKEIPYLRTLVNMHEEMHVEIKPNKSREPTPRLTSFGEFFSKIVIPIGTGIGAIFIIWWGFRQVANQTKELVNQREALEQQTELARETLEHTRKVLAEQTDLARQTLEHTQKEVAATVFNNAIKHLGNRNHAAVLGGIYALNDLVRNYNDKKHIKDRFNKTVFEILCSFIREETGNPEYQKKVDKDQVASNVIQTIIDRLFLRSESVKLYQREDEHEGPYKARLRDADLRYVDFNSRKVPVNLSEADLREVDLSGARLKGAKLQQADLREARLLRAELTGAHLEVDLVRSKPGGERRTILREAKLMGANLTGANLTGADLRDADLREADLTATNLTGADLAGADLRCARMKEIVISAETKFSNKTKVWGVHNQGGICAFSAFYASYVHVGIPSTTFLSSIGYDEDTDLLTHINGTAALTPLTADEIEELARVVLTPDAIAAIHLPPPSTP